ncbi:MAG: hypothetical protein IPL95_14415 [Saprospiraceae bacterium]|nr:hypothetical protein [Saprospiraceae bacterium]
MKIGYQTNEIKVNFEIKKDILKYYLDRSIRSKFMLDIMICASISTPHHAQTGCTSHYSNVCKDRENDYYYGKIMELVSPEYDKHKNELGSSIRTSLTDLMKNS